jgi:hypothetical protein
MGGNIESAVNGAFSAALFYGVGELSGAHEAAAAGRAMTGAEHLAQTFGHAVVGCVSASIAGGSCGSGAASAGFAAAAGPLLPGADISAARFVSRMIVGGIGSRLAGDNFANGATSAAFAYLFNDVAGARDADARADGACGGKGAMTPSNACYAAREAAAKEWAGVPRSQTLQVSTPELDLLGGVGLIKALVSNFVRTFSLSLADVGAMVGAGGPKAIHVGGGMANAERYFGALAKEYGSTISPARGGVRYFDFVESGVTYRVNLYPVSTSFKQPAISIGDTYKLRF